MVTILITGVAGMIGSHMLDKLLAKNYRVIGLDNYSFGSSENIAHNFSHPNFTFHEGDVTDFELLKKLSKNVDVILHMAAYKKIGEDNLSMPSFNVNGKGTEYVFLAAQQNGCKVVYASTSDVYGMSNDLPFREDGDLLLGPSMIRRWSYAVSKLYGEQMAYAFYRDCKVPMVIVRYFGGFSHRSSFKWSGGHIPIFTNAILNNEECVIHGDGLQTRSMAYVEDLVDGTILAMESEKAVGEIINLGNHEEMSVLDSAKLIHEIAETGHELKLKFVTMESVFGSYKDIQRRIPDLSKAQRLLGYAPKYTLKQAVEFMVKEVKKVNA